MEKKRAAFISFLILIFIFSNSGSTSAQSSSPYTLIYSDMQIALNATLPATINFEYGIQIHEPDNIDEFVFTFNFDLENVETIINGTIVPNSIINQNSNSILNVVAITKLGIDDFLIMVITADSRLEQSHIDSATQQFFLNLNKNPLALVNNITIFLPPGYFVTQNFDTLDLFPNPTSITSNGQVIILSWVNIPISTSIDQIFVQFTNVQNNSSLNGSDNKGLLIGLWVALILVSLLFISALIYFYFKYYKPIPASSNDASDTTIVKDVVEIVKPLILTPSELEILKVIHQHGESIYQSELVQLTGLGKVRVSQYLSQFEQDGIIKKVKMGRENLIQLNVTMTFED